MKKLISDIGGMKTFLEIRTINSTSTMKYFKISTFYDGAKDPNSERTQFDMCLDEEHYQYLKDFINEM